MHILFEQRIQRGGVTYIYNGLSGDAKNNVLAVGYLCMIAAAILGILGGVFATMSRDGPDGYGYVAKIECWLINHRSWCDYDMILKESGTCSIKNTDSIFRIDEVVPVNIDGAACYVARCGWNCDSVDMGRRFLYAAVALSSVVALYVFAHFLREMLMRPDEIIHGTST